MVVWRLAGWVRLHGLAKMSRSIVAFAKFAMTCALLCLLHQVPFDIHRNAHFVHTDCLSVYLNRCCNAKSHPLADVAQLSAAHDKAAGIKPSESST